MYTCEQCGAEFDYPLRACELCGGRVQNNGRGSPYTQPETTRARSTPQPQYYKPEEPRYLPPVSGVFCRQCGANNPPSADFCGECGARIKPAPHYLPQQEPQRPYNEYLPPRDSFQQHHAAAQGLSAIFGLHPAAAIFIVAVNLMAMTPQLLLHLASVFTGGVSEGADWIGSSVLGLVVGIVTYLIQKTWNRDDNENAALRAIIAAVLTAIPVGLPAIFFGGYALLQKLLRTLSGKA